MLRSASSLRRHCILVEGSIHDQCCAACLRRQLCSGTASELQLHGSRLDAPVAGQAQGEEHDCHKQFVSSPEKFLQALHEPAGGDRGPEPCFRAQEPQSEAGDLEAPPGIPLIQLRIATILIRGASSNAHVC